MKNKGMERIKPKSLTKAISLLNKVLSNFNKLKVNLKELILMS